MAWVVLSPLVPIILLHTALEKSAAGIDWVMRDSWLVNKLGGTAERIEAWGYR